MGSRMDQTVKIIECPRDAWQGLPTPIAPEVKAEYLRQLIDTGFTHIDAVSFVSPAAVPQMADSERVLACLAPPDTMEIIGIVVNEKGAQRAIRTKAVKTLGFPYSISSQFLERNQRQTLEQALAPYPALPSLPEDRLSFDEAAKFQAIDYIRDTFAPKYAVSTVDGVRVDFGDGWGVVRASNTEPAITTRFEAQTPARVAEIRALMLGAVAQFKREHEQA